MSRSKARRAALKWARYNHRYGCVWPNIKITRGYDKAANRLFDGWGDDSPYWPTNPYRRNPMLVRVALDNCRKGTRFPEESFRNWVARFRDQYGLSADYWEARTLREPNARRRRACLEIAELMASVDDAVGAG